MADINAFPIPTKPFNVAEFKGADGRTIELSASTSHIRWRYLGDTAWTDLVSLASLTGKPGSEVEMRSEGSFIQWRLLPDGAWVTLLNTDQFIPQNAVTSLDVSQLIVVAEGMVPAEADQVLNAIYLEVPA